MSRDLRRPELDVPGISPRFQNAAITLVTSKERDTMVQTKTSKSCEECKLRKVRCESRPFRLRLSARQACIFTLSSARRRQYLGLQQLQSETPGDNYPRAFRAHFRVRSVMSPVISDRGRREVDQWEPIFLMPHQTLAVS